MTGDGEVGKFLPPLLRGYVFDALDITVSGPCAEPVEETINSGPADYVIRCDSITATPTATPTEVP